MKIAAIAFTENGARIVRLLQKETGAAGYVFEKYVSDGLEPFADLNKLVTEEFPKNDALIFVGACGIAVRAIAPHIRSKLLDPAVVVLDERGKFAIPILSGHIGGANALAEKVAVITGGTSVITTATDINNKFAVDVFASKNNLYIDDMEIAKLISTEILKGKKIGIYSDFPYKNPPEELTEDSEIGICISHNAQKKPFKTTLNLIPKNIVVGIGCKKGITDVRLAAESFLAAYEISPRAVCMIASIDVKRDEAAILRLADSWEVPFKTYSAEQLMAQSGDFAVSEFVRKTVGADNVCERSVAAAGAKLIVKKTVKNGVTLALGRRDTELDFDAGR